MENFFFTGFINIKLIFNRAKKLKIFAIKENQKAYTSNKITNKKNEISTIKSSFGKASYNSANLIAFYGLNIKPAARLLKSDYGTPKYIAEIFKARSFYGDREIIELGMGNPDILPPEGARKTLKKKIDDLWSHRYNFPKGEWDFRKGASDWFDNRFGVKLNPSDEIMMSAGASDGVDMVLAAYTEKGDRLLIPDPGYTVYRDLAAKNDLEVVPMDLTEANGYLPDFEKLKPEDLKGVKGMVLNYPNNPMGVFAPLNFYEKAVKFAKENNIFIIHDFDNSEITHYGTKPVGILNVEGAKDVAFQVHTLSKAHNMPGMRIGFVASNKTFIDNLLNVKNLQNNSVYTATQAAAISALKDTEYINKVNAEHRLRKNTAVQRLKELGSTAEPTQGTYYLWTKVPPGFKSDEFFKYVLHKGHVALTPGTIYGKNGEGFVRVVMSGDTDIINKAFDKIKNGGIRFDTPKWELPIETQNEIEKIARGEINLKPKYIRDFEDYKLVLQKKEIELKERLKDKPKELEIFIPKLSTINNIPTYIMKDRQMVYLKNSHSLKPCFGEIREIMPFSKNSAYDNLREVIANTWVKDKTSDSEIIKMYKEGKLYPDATYITMFSDNKLQGLVNVEVQDSEFWIRGLNTAPWNQGEDPQIQGVGSALMARAMSLCLETGQPILKLAPNSQKNAAFYKAMGFTDAGAKEFNGIDYPVMSIDEKGMRKFLEEYQRYLSY